MQSVAPEAEYLPCSQTEQLSVVPDENFPASHLMQEVLLLAKPAPQTLHESIDTVA